MPPPFSVLVLTLNEERDLPACLDSLRDCDDIVVLDSGSTDRTAEIARAARARVVLHPFENFAGQRNFAQKEIRFKHNWVFHLDADERMTPELALECSEAIESAGETDGFLVAPRMIFEGRWIPHCTDFPAWQARLARVPRFEFVEAGHGQREAPGQLLGRLQTGYLHDLSSGGEAEWLEKHRRYARAEALAFLQSGVGAGWRDLFSEEPLRRRRALKHQSMRLPFRPALRFIYQYVLRRGFLDGRPGLRYCRLLARYEGFTSAELRRLSGHRT